MTFSVDPRSRVGLDIAMPTLVTVHILWQGSTACGLWWGDAPTGDRWVAPWDWRGLDGIAPEGDYTRCEACESAFGQADNRWRKQVWKLIP